MQRQRLGPVHPHVGEHAAGQVSWVCTAHLHSTLIVIGKDSCGYVWQRRRSRIAARSGLQTARACGTRAPPLAAAARCAPSSPSAQQQPSQQPASAGRPLRLATSPQRIHGSSSACQRRPRSCLPTAGTTIRRHAPWRPPLPAPRHHRRHPHRSPTCEHLGHDTQRGGTALGSGQLGAGAQQWRWRVARCAADRAFAAGRPGRQLQLRSWGCRSCCRSCCRRRWHSVGPPVACWQRRTRAPPQQLMQ